jgi:predicted dehydrogenase
VGLVSTVSESLVKIAVIGAGRLASEHAKALKLLNNVEIVGVCSRTWGSGERFASEFGIKECAITTEVSNLFSLTRADAVVVAVSEESIYEVSSRVFEDPWVILLEKPAGLDFDEAKSLAHLASIHCRETFVALNRRHYGNIKSVLADVQSKEGKRIVQVSDQQWTRDGLSRGGVRNLSENWMYVNAIHTIDLVRYFCRGTIDRVITTGWVPGVEPRIVSAVIHFSSGDRATYQGVWDAPGPWAVTLTTQAGRWEMNPLERTNFLSAGAGEKVQWEDALEDKMVKAGLLVQAQNLIQAVHGESHELVTIQDSLDTMSLIDSIYFPKMTERWISDE